MTFRKCFKPAPTDGSSAVAAARRILPNNCTSRRRTTLAGNSLLVLEDPGHALDPLVRLPHRRPQGGRLLQAAPQQLPQSLQPSGQLPARAATRSRLEAMRLSRSCSFSPEAANGGSPSSVKAARTAAQ